jgi:hypothetical protein
VPPFAVMSATEPVAAVLPADDRLLARHVDLYGPDGASRTASLAHALASSPAWDRLRDEARLVVRPDVGLIGVVGSIRSEDRSLVDALGWQVRDLLTRLRPVPHGEVRETCLDLAREIRERLDPAELAGARLVGIPRGGLIVAGLLGYALGVRPAQVGSSGPTTGLTIIVDDCAISGTRLREQLRKQPGEVLVALLHAHPELCRRVEAAEPRVKACLAARDLVDHAPRRPDYPQWKQRWEERSRQDYWTGDPDHVCYPWNEPDALIWNPARGHAEAGWRVVPPSWCLKNTAESHDGDVQLCRPAGAEVTPVETVVWAELGDSVVVAGLDQPKALVLRGSASAMWRAVVAHGNRAIAAEATATAYGQPIERVRRDLDRFVDELRRLQVLRTL